MPELPEVESLTRSLAKILKNARISEAKFFRKDLRFPIPIDEISKHIVSQEPIRVFRRSKYSLVESEHGYLIFHFGMSGYLHLSTKATQDFKHTHAVFTVESSSKTCYLHYVDPRRFGFISFCYPNQLEEHPLFRDLGPEPLELTSNELAQLLWKLSRKKKKPIKNFIMDAKIVVGVGNIYASEALFLAGIRPSKSAGKASQSSYQRLAESIQTTLRRAISCGGTTFRDFKNTDGNPGYFSIELNVYGKSGQLCPKCKKTNIEMIRQSARASFFCKTCQN